MQRAEMTIIVRSLSLLLVCAALAVAADLPSGVDRPSGQSSEDRVGRLIEQLGDDDYFVRQRAQAELAEFSFEVFAALTAATTHEDLEVAARARYLLRLLRVEWSVASDSPEVKKLLANYEVQNLPRKVERMRALAALGNHAGVPALCRLVRYERSAVLSKYAAIELLNRQPPGEPPAKELAELVRSGLGPGRHTAAVWLLTYLRFGDNPSAVMADWAELVEAEDSRLRTSPATSSLKIVGDLIRFQIGWLRQLPQKEQAVAAIRRLFDLKQGDERTLAELLLWLVEQEAWDAVDELSEKAAPRFANRPILLYAVARAIADAGQRERAARAAHLARGLGPGRDSQSLARHYLVAYDLQQRGWLDWAEAEYRQVISTGGKFYPAVIAAHRELAEMLHDQGDNLRAAAVLEPLAEAAEAQPKRVLEAEITAPALRSRLSYFYACHFESQQDRARQRAYLDKARKADETDIDVLIACYRLPDQTAEFRRQIVAMIRRAAARLREEITKTPNDPGGYNQYAWLVGNTEGDLDAALEYSKKSIELRPGSGVYYDTLAHVYFGRGDYENAVKTQVMAAELEPHSGLIARQLEVFRRKWEQQKKEQQPK